MEDDEKPPVPGATLETPRKTYIGQELTDGQVTKEMNQAEAKAGFEQVVEMGDPVVVIFRSEQGIGIWCSEPPNPMMFAILTDLVEGYGKQLEAMLLAESQVEGAAEDAAGQTKES